VERSDTHQFLSPKVMGIASLHPSYELPQQPLPRHVIELEPDAIGILEQY
jgi:hypothetical protein